MAERRHALKLVGIAALWLATGRFLPDVLWRGLPRVLLDSLSLPAYGMLCQIVTTFVGVAAAWLSFERPRAALGVEAPSGWQAVGAALLAPALFVVASYVALRIAEPYLLAELATEGAGASRRNAGAFGKAVTQAPLALTLVWGAVLAAIAEELAFRGALFGAIEKGALALFGAKADPSAATPKDESRGGGGRTGRSREEWLSGLLAVVVAAAVFGALHADMKGSVGIVRVVSTTCLGLACGSARFASGTVLVPMIVHFTYNSVSLGLGRGFFRGDSEPLLSIVPNRLLATAVVGAFAVVAVTVARRASAGRG